MQDPHGRPDLKQKLNAKEAVFYVAWMVGAILTAITLQNLGAHRFVMVPCTLVCGTVCGLFVEKLYDHRYTIDGRRKARVLSADEVACPAQGCQWHGKRRDHALCPRCNERLPL